jgi:choline-sulfatase
MSRNPRRWTAAVRRDIVRAPHPPRARMSNQPNILILMADQLTALALPAYGNRVARTPHVDALAEHGTVFENAYCNSPLCAPSRGVFVYGRLPSGTGVYDNAAEFPSQMPTFAHYLRHAGYRTILTGKMHFCGPDQLHGFEERLTTDIYPADYAWTPDWTRFEDRPDWYHVMDSVAQSGPCTRTNQIDFDEEVVFSARQRLFDIARDTDARPFCMVVSLTHPHDPFTISDEYWNRYMDADIPPPRLPTAADDPHAKRLRHVIGLDRQPVTPAEIQAARRAYYGEVAYVDDNIGRVLAALNAARLADNTIVMLVADHGEMLGERGLWFKMNFWEPACRVPLIVHAPGHFAAGRVAGAVSLVDLLPTLAEIAGNGRPPDYAGPIDGRSLLPHLSRTGGHDEVIGEYLAEGVVAPMVMIRRGGQKFIHTPTDPDQLFDLSADPDEITNLATRPEHAAAVAGYRRDIGHRWDLDELHSTVLDSQRGRRFVTEALQRGRQTAWDWLPPRDASRMYVRNSIPLEELEAMARFPKWQPPSP